MNILSGFRSSIRVSIVPISLFLSLVVSLATAIGQRAEAKAGAVQCVEFFSIGVNEAARAMRREHVDFAPAEALFSDANQAVQLFSFAGVQPAETGRNLVDMIDAHTGIDELTAANAIRREFGEVASETRQLDWLVHAYRMWELRPSLNTRVRAVVAPTDYQMDGGLLPGAIAPRNGRPQKLIMVALIVDIRAFEPSRGDRPRERDHQADLAARDANRAVEEAQARIESAIGQLTRASLMQPSAAVVVGDRVAIPPQMMFQDLGPLALVTGPVRRVPGLGVGLEVGPSEPVPGVHMTSQIPRTDGHSVIMPVLLNPSQMTMAEFHAFLNQLYVGPNRARLN